jgi:diadenosine tetraphosphate (Ap4A) HIT family hydrolase
VDVPHAHVHLIPFSDAKQLDHEFHKSSDPPADYTELAELAKKLAF